MLNRSGYDATLEGETGDRTIGTDLLEGAEKIASYLYDDPTQRRKVYHLAETSKIPVFRLGATLCARKSTLLAWIERQESQASKESDCAEDL